MRFQNERSINRSRFDNWLDEPLKIRNQILIWILCYFAVTQTDSHWFRKDSIEQNMKIRDWFMRLSNPRSNLVIIWYESFRISFNLFLIKVNPSGLVRITSKNLIESDRGGSFLAVRDLSIKRMRDKISKPVIRISFNSSSKIDLIYKQNCKCISENCAPQSKT